MPLDFRSQSQMQRQGLSRQAWQSPGFRGAHQTQTEMPTQVIFKREHRCRAGQEPRDQTIKCGCGGIQKDTRAERPSKKAGHAEDDGRPSLCRQDIPARPKAGNLTRKDSDYSSDLRPPLEYQ